MEKCHFSCRKSILWAACNALETISSHHKLFLCSISGGHRCLAIRCFPFKLKTRSARLSGWNAFMTTPLSAFRMLWLFLSLVTTQLGFKIHSKLHRQQCPSGHLYNFEFSFSVASREREREREKGGGGGIISVVHHRPYLEWTVLYSLVQWNWFSDVTGCMKLRCIHWRQRTDYTAPGCVEFRRFLHVWEQIRS